MIALNVSTNRIKTKDPDSVGAPNGAYKRMELRWDLIRDLLGGTLRMRQTGQKWLPIEDEEELLQYDRRLCRSILYNAYGDTIDKIVAKPFSKQITVEPEPDGELEGMLKNTDLEGNDITSFSASLFEDMVNWGKCHVLVDFPVAKQTALTDGVSIEGSGESRSVGELPTTRVQQATAPLPSASSTTNGALENKLNVLQEKQLDIRPFFVCVSPLDLIGWKSTTQKNGAEKLTEIRIRETRVEQKGDFGETEVVYVRVIRENTWELHREDPETHEFALKDGPHTNTLGRIPLHTAYAKRVGFMESEPPFEDLGWLNLIHYQSDSDQRNILRFVRFGLLVATGATEEDLEQGLTVGPNRLITLVDVQANLQYVEHSGAAIGAGAEDLVKIEQRMEILGLQPLIARTGTETATGRVMDKIETSSEVQRWIRSLERMLEESFKTAGDWINKEIELRVDIFSDFALVVKTKEDLQFLLELSALGILPDEELLEAYKRRGVLPEDTDVEDLVKRAREQKEIMAEEEDEDQITAEDILNAASV